MSGGNTLRAELTVVVFVVARASRGVKQVIACQQLEELRESHRLACQYKAPTG